MGVVPHQHVHPAQPIIIGHLPPSSSDGHLWGMLTDCHSRLMRHLDEARAEAADTRAQLHAVLSLNVTAANVLAAETTKAQAAAAAAAETAADAVRDAEEAGAEAASWKAADDAATMQASALQAELTGEVARWRAEFQSLRSQLAAFAAMSATPARPPGELTPASSAAAGTPPPASTAPAAPVTPPGVTTEPLPRVLVL